MLYHDCVFAHVSCHIKRYVLSTLFKYALHPVHRSPTYIMVLFLCISLFLSVIIFKDWYELHYIGNVNFLGPYSHTSYDIS